jgi:hypothetical protein
VSDYTKEEFNALVKQRDGLESQIKNLSIQRDQELAAVRDSIGEKRASLQTKLMALEASIEPQLADITDRYAAEISNLKEQLTKLHNVIDPKLDSPPDIVLSEAFHIPDNGDWNNRKLQHEFRRMSQRHGWAWTGW